MPSIFSEKTRENGLIAAGGNGIIQTASGNTPASRLLSSAPCIMTTPLKCQNLRFATGTESKFWISSE